MSATLESQSRTSFIDSRWTRALLAYVALYLLAWILVPLAINTVPPGDNLEQLNWAEHLAWGYSKHPPFPTLVLWLLERVFPAGVPLTHVLGALDVAVMLLAAYCIARDVFDGHKAVLAVLFASCITYYTNRLHFYNHNTALLVAYALSVFFSLRAARTLQLKWFALLGLAWGIGMLSKYQMVIGIACNVIYFWTVRDKNLFQFIKGLCIAALVTLVVIAPHIVWLVENKFPSFDYAAKFVAANLPWAERPSDIAGFLGNQLGRVAPLALLLIVFLRLPHVRRAADASNTPTRIDTRRLLAIHTWGPLVLMCALSLFFGVDLQMHWGTAFVWMLPLWFLGTRHGGKLASLSPSAAFIGVIVLQVAMLLSYR